MTAADRKPTELVSGELVDLHLHGVEVGWIRAGETTFVLHVADDVEPRTRYLSLYLDELPPDAVTVARRTPVDGEPQPGDVWTDRFGSVWFAIERPEGLTLYSDGRGTASGSYLWRPWRDLHSGERGPIKLEYRPRKPDAADVDVPCEPGGHQWDWVPSAPEETMACTRCGATPKAMVSRDDLATIEVPL